MTSRGARLLPRMRYQAPRYRVRISCFARVCSLYSHFRGSSSASFGTVGRYSRQRKLRPLATVQSATTRLRRAAAPLLEEERDALGLAEVAELAQPLALHGPRPVSRLATGDQPVDVREVKA